MWVIGAPGEPMELADEGLQTISGYPLPSPVPSLLFHRCEFVIKNLSIKLPYHLPLENPTCDIWGRTGLPVSSLSAIMAPVPL